MEIRNPVNLPLKDYKTKADLECKGSTRSSTIKGLSALQSICCGTINLLIVVITVVVVCLQNLNFSHNCCIKLYFVYTMYWVVYGSYVLHCQRSYLSQVQVKVKNGKKGFQFGKIIRGSI